MLNDRPQKHSRPSDGLCDIDEREEPNAQFPAIPIRHFLIPLDDSAYSRIQQPSEAHDCEERGSGLLTGC